MHSKQGNWERRDAKRAKRMGVSGSSVKLLSRLVPAKIKGGKQWKTQ